MSNMKAAAIIAEYNPFHNGHKYHIEQTRAGTGATHVAVIMSGNFTQRGDVAVIPKHRRAAAALANGADLVIELPAAYALSSAEQFALGAVGLVNALNGIEHLSFGSEGGNLALLEEAATAVHYAQTTDEFSAALKSGMSFPAALQSTVEELYTDDVVEMLTTPNNTLAVEYIKALNETGSTVKPFAVAREGAAHDEHRDSLPESGIVSATEVLCASQIRELLLAGRDVSGYVPPGCGDFGSPETLADIARLEVAILAKLRTMSVRDIKKSPGLTGGLENRVYKAARAARSLRELYFLAKTKRYTMARIRRAVLCCFLGITRDDARLKPQYLRILGMNDRGKEMLANCTLPADTSLKALAEKGENAKRQAFLEARCTSIYELAFGDGHRRMCGRDFTDKPVIV